MHTKIDQVDRNAGKSVSEVAERGVREVHLIRQPLSLFNFTVPLSTRFRFLCSPNRYKSELYISFMLLTLKSFVLSNL